MAEEQLDIELDDITIDDDNMKAGTLLSKFFNVEITPTGTVFVPNSNIAFMISDQELMSIGTEVISGYNADKDSMNEWAEFVELGLDLVKQEKEARSEPWDGAANFKSPVLMNAALKFSDRISTQLLRTRDIVKTSIIGNDPDGEKFKKSERISDYMNYQLNVDMPEWRDEHHKLLYDLPYIGTVFKKTFFDPLLERNVSDLITYPNFAVNNGATSLQRLRRFSEIHEFSINEVNERILSGIWLDVPLTGSGESEDSQGQQEFQIESDGFMSFIEQQMFWDMDGDGYEEPYIVTAEINSGTVVRIVPRFEPDDVILKNQQGNRARLSDLFLPTGELIKEESERKIVRIICSENITKYGFIPDPEGGFLDIGFSHLLGALTSAVNTTTNQLIDSATLSNVQGGWLAKGFRRKMGNSRFKPGEWKQTGLSAVDMKGGILPLPVKEPSPTLLALNEGLIQNAKELSASADISSIVGANAPAATTLSLIQEQMISVNAILLRIYRSMSREFDKLFQLNSQFGSEEEYQNVLDDPNASLIQDFSLRTFDIVPVANPEVSSKMQHIQLAAAELSQLDNIAAAGGNIQPVIESFLEAIGAQNIDEIFPDQDASQKLQELLVANPELINIITGEQERLDLISAAQADAIARVQQREDLKLASDLSKSQAEIDRINMETLKKRIEAEKTDAEISKVGSETVLNLEKAESEDIKNQTDNYTSSIKIDTIV